MLIDVLRVVLGIVLLTVPGIAMYFAFHAIAAVFEETATKEKMK